MKSDTLIELERLSCEASDCSVVAAAETKSGGVDPLGLRQINFDLMNGFKFLDAFEERLRPILSHEPFNGWNACSLTRTTAEQWAETWDMGELLARSEAPCMTG